jgi:hypothetical protein
MLGQALPVEQAEKRLRVADVDGEEHAPSLLQPFESARFEKN